MDRIKIIDFLSLSFSEQHTFIKNLQHIRTDAIAKSRVTLVRKTKKKKSKAIRKPKDPALALITAMKKMSPKQLQALKEKYNV